MELGAAVELYGFSSAARAEALRDRTAQPLQAGQAARSREDVVELDNESYVVLA